jgi:hypothetical protein
MSSDILKYVGFDPNPKINENGEVLVEYINVETSNGVVSTVVQTDTIECNLTEDEMTTEVIKLLTSFPVRKTSDSQFTTQIAELKAGNQIAVNAKRGAGNTKYENVLYYLGTHPADAPIIVVKHDGMYGVFKHPNFEKYGFVLV